jgi:predicted small lipoprotein YifL
VFRAARRTSWSVAAAAALALLAAGCGRRGALEPPPEATAAPAQAGAAQADANGVPTAQAAGPAGVPGGPNGAERDLNAASDSRRVDSYTLAPRQVPTATSSAFDTPQAAAPPKKKDDSFLLDPLL